MPAPIPSDIAKENASIVLLSAPLEQLVTSIKAITNVVVHRAAYNSRPVPPFSFPERY